MRTREIYVMKKLKDLKVDERIKLRHRYDPKKREDLKNSMIKHGFLTDHPIITTAGGIILKGFNRHDIAKELDKEGHKGFKEIPTILNPLKNELDVLESQLLEILHSADHSPIEKGEAIKKYIEMKQERHENQKHDSSGTDSVRREKWYDFALKDNTYSELGISETRFKEYVSVLKDPELTKDVKEKKISHHAAELLLKVKDNEKRAEYEKAIISGEMKVKELKEIIKPKKAAPKPPKSPESPQTAPQGEFTGQGEGNGEREDNSPSEFGKSLANDFGKQIPGELVIFDQLNVIKHKINETFDILKDSKLKVDFRNTKILGKHDHHTNTNNGIWTSWDAALQSVSTDLKSLKEKIRKRCESVERNS